MNEIKLTKRGQALVKNAKKAKGAKKEWNYADYYKNYEKKLESHKNPNKISRFYTNLCAAICEKVNNFSITNFFKLNKRLHGEKNSPAA